MPRAKAQFLWQAIVRSASRGFIKKDEGVGEGVGTELRNRPRAPPSVTPLAPHLRPTALDRAPLLSSQIPWQQCKLWAARRMLPSSWPPAFSGTRAQLARSVRDRQT